MIPRKISGTEYHHENDGKTNLSVWLEVDCFMCKVGMADDDLFIIKFLLIYLAD
jgi:hypothetical protein